MSRKGDVSSAEPPIQLPRLRPDAGPSTGIEGRSGVAPSTRAVLVAIGGPTDSRRAIETGAELARALRAPLEAVHIETPGRDQQDNSDELSAAFAFAQERGAAVARIPAVSLEDGLAEYLRSTCPSHLVIEQGSARRMLGLQRSSLADRLIETVADIRLVLVAGPAAERRAAGPAIPVRGSLRDYAVALAAVATTAMVAWMLREWTTLISTSILFLFPVIAVAARSSLGPTLFAVAASVLLHNLLLLQPALGFDPFAVQSWITAAVLLVGGCYTSMLTSSLRGRVRLSDRSARESARLAAFAQRLTRIADWTETGKAVCEEISALLGVEAVIFREVDGKLTKVADHPYEVVLDPLDDIALQWVWEHDEQSGPDAHAFQAGSWQFHPLSTSLGTLAVIGLARPDGRPPVGPDQAMLFSTLLAQASLAHERLRLEDQMRCT